MKKCGKCKIEKEYSKFNKCKSNKKDGLQNSCKSCEKSYREKNKEKAKDYRESHKEEMKAYRDSHKKEKDIWYKNNKEELKLKSKIYQQTPRGKELKKIRKKKWQKENPLKYKAHRILQKAVARGAIIKPINCSVCNKTNCKISGHHDDYSKPLVVIWVCDKCHPSLDKQRRLKELNKDNT